MARTDTRKPETRGRIFDVALALRDLDVGGRGPFTHLEGRAVPYRTWTDVGWYLEQHEVDSLKASTTGGTGKALPLYLWHDSHRFPIGRSVEWRSSDDGLHGVWGLNDRPEAQEAAQLAKSGELGYLSIGFSPIRSGWEFVDDWDPAAGWDHCDRCSRLESRLIEVSVVGTPAFADAEITLVRDRSPRLEDTPDRDEYVAWRTREIEWRARAAGVDVAPRFPRLEAAKRERARLER